MEIEEFLAEYAEGYLFKDLQTMAGTVLPAGETKGALGYPMVSAVLSGMELLGGLLSVKEFAIKNGDSYFAWYWNNFLVESHPQYGIKDGHELVRSLVRNGLAHVFLTAPRIRITRGASWAHFQLYDNDGKTELCIDCEQFSQDFQESYRREVLPILRGNPRVLRGNRTITRDTMQKRLQECLDRHAAEAEELFARLARPIGQIRVMAYVETMFSSSGPATITGPTHPYTGGAVPPWS